MPAPKDQTGRRFGRLTVQRLSGREFGRRSYECICDCGTVVTKLSSALLKSECRSCGCLRIEACRLLGTTVRKGTGRKLENDLSGLTFGNWLVLHRSNHRGKSVQWACECACGTKRDVASGSLLHATHPTRSCGCLARREVSRAASTHRKSQTRAYSIWSGMKQRCNNPRNAGWLLYGGRGITYSSEWAHFEHFLRDLGEPSVGQSLDRIDPNGPYSRDNCRWATMKQQCNNRRSNVRVTVDGLTMTIAEWANVNGAVSAATMYYRHQQGLKGRDIVFVPLSRKSAKPGARKKVLLLGTSYHETYRIWSGIKQRCSNGYASMAPEWSSSFSQFWADMGPRPSPTMSVDRINNSLGYSRANCRWADRVVQGRNKTNNTILTINPDTKTVAEWSEISGNHRGTIMNRIRKGWTHERAVFHRHSTKRLMVELLCNRMEVKSR